MNPRSVQQRWTVRESDPQAREELSRALSVTVLVSAVLTARGIHDHNKARAFLAPELANLPDPALLSGMEAAAERLAEAIEGRETVWVYTDYDVDGVTSAAVLAEFLTWCGCPHHVYLPRRDREGYGLCVSAVQEIARRGGRLVVTADCGIAAVEAAAAASNLGVDLIITDHHNPGEELPDAVAVVNPKLPGSAYPDRTLAGVGVAWNLIAATRRVLRKRQFFGRACLAEPDIRTLLDLVALGTVADVVPLREVNRILVAHGLRQLNRDPREGVAALKEVAGVRGELRAGHIGFQLGPRLNAAGRMEGPRSALDVLVARDRLEAQQLAQILDGLNRYRQGAERSIFETAAARVEDETWWPARWSLVVEGEAWHPGVVGIVASRLVERYHRPCVVLTVDDGEAKGSARSIRGLDLHRVLTECEDLLSRFGGHAAAAGLQLRAEQIPAFRERFEERVRHHLSEEELLPEIVIDAWVDFADLGLRAVGDLACLEPYGPGNPGPLFATRDVEVLDVRSLGRDAEHLKFRLRQGGQRLEAVAWRKAEVLAGVTAGSRADFAFTPQIRTWNGSERVQLQVEAVRLLD